MSLPGTTESFMGSICFGFVVGPPSVKPAYFRLGEYAVTKELWNVVLVSWGMSWVTVVELIRECYGVRFGACRGSICFVRHDPAMLDVVNLGREES